MRQLTIEEFKDLEDLKQNGVYRAPLKHLDHRCSYRTSERILFKVLERYLAFKKWSRSFKARYFGRSFFADCPLSNGEIRSAIRYGMKNNLLTMVNGSNGNRSYKMKNGE